MGGRRDARKLRTVTGFLEWQLDKLLHEANAPCNPRGVLGVCCPRQGDRGGAYFVLRMVYIRLPSTHSPLLSGKMAWNDSNPPLKANGPKGLFLCILTIISQVFVAVVVFAGCATDTGTKTELNGAALAQMTHLEVQVSVLTDFSVVLDREEVHGIDYLLLPVAMTGLGGLAVATGGEATLEGVRDRKDAQRAKDLRTTIAEINLQSLAQEALMNDLRRAPRFQSVRAASGQDGLSPAGTAVLRVRIENWGLYADKSEDRSLRLVQIGLNSTVTLVDSGGRVAWEHRDHFTGGVHRAIGEYSSSPALLKREIEETVQRYCARVANEIRYAQ